MPRIVLDTLASSDGSGGMYLAESRKITVMFVGLPLLQAGSLELANLVLNLILQQVDIHFGMERLVVCHPPMHSLALLSLLPLYEICMFCSNYYRALRYTTCGCNFKHLCGFSWPRTKEPCDNF